MASVYPHARDLYALIASSDAPDEIRATARSYAALDIDAVIPDLAWPELVEAIEGARWPGRRALRTDTTDVREVAADHGNRN